MIEPLKTLRIVATKNEHGIGADITFHARALPVEEPRFTYRHGPATFMDYTRLTQNGTYEGWIEVAGKRIALSRDRIAGTRDRSWGVRPIGMGNPQGAAPPRSPQFYWLWSPLNFPEKFMLYHNNADGRRRGTPRRSSAAPARTSRSTWRRAGRASTTSRARGMRRAR